jgi:tetratricopeptide (TPR) repeat protein
VAGRRREPRAPARRRTAVAAVAAAAALALLAAALPAPACGPWFPNTLLPEDGAALEAPLNPFLYALWQLPELPATGLVADKSWPPAATATASRQELIEALTAANGQHWSRFRPVVAAHDALREALRHAAEASSAGEPPPDLGGLEVPAGLPLEMAVYLEGALAFRRGERDAARAAWERVLALPADQREYRSTWAAFMLGKLALLAEHDPDTAIARFHQTRELAAEGFRDALALAAATLGWEARAEWDRGRLPAAFERYAEALVAGDREAGQSLHQLCAAVLGGGRERMDRVAGDPLARAVVTAYLGAHPGAFAAAGDWTAAVREAGGQATGAGSIAWTAYRAGRFDEAERWVEIAAGDDPHAAWVRGKLALRAGDLEAAMPLLDAAAGGLADITPGQMWHWSYGEGAPVATGARAAGEAGVVALALGRRTEAFDRLLRAGYWLDAAYLAERVLTVDELRAYVDRSWPRELTDDSAWGPGNAGLDRPPERWLAWRIRHLLARRLARAGRLAEAVPYYPGDELRRAAAELAGRLACADGGGCPDAERTADLWRAARLVRDRGMALVGTELEPDWAVWGGNFDLGSFGLAPPDRAGHRHCPPSADERRRWEASAPTPDRRYHYRWVAADYAWRAARRMPDGSPDTALVLATAGSWIKNLDPEGADRFYTALVRRCGDTELGREADRRRWFPELPGS